ncbi:thiol-disulfide isomerase/thioredoxin [Pedobacter cryoconitis]|uniref:peroxiredoxin family protein n=1 Tax=Pedobacter cryoconitis TaxID=188932 RepID=UPI00160A1052|nr:TlpA disulfide reductase family protein [Pedobacter cryoconitis]MBB6271733.1 thiol-disulfide isomerase/thioredoxin [Pedobacter cryoconitis]
MIKKYGLLGLCMAFSLYTSAQLNVKQGHWHASLQRKDGHHLPFEMDIQQKNGITTCYILNSTERIKTEDPVYSGDSVLIKMPVFESYFKIKIINKDSLNGIWVTKGESKDIILPFAASAGEGRFPYRKTNNPKQVQGKWSIEFTRANKTKRPAIGEIVQKGSSLSGSVLTPAGDYRYLDGVVSGDSLFLSTFDGSHALLLTAKIKGDSLSGYFYAGQSGLETWTAVKKADVVLTPAVTAIKEDSDGKLDFTFKDLKGKPVSLQDERFKGKVVILQLMGSWCPNCMDETAFLSKYYLKNKDRGVEIIALAYELSTDEERSKKSLQKFQTQFNVQYTMLNTGATAGDPQRTEKTLPQLTAIKVFPTTIILDKNGKISDINTAFYGPGAGDYHLKYKENFEKKINNLLDQKL